MPDSEALEVPPPYLNRLRIVHFRAEQVGLHEGDGFLRIDQALGELISREFAVLVEQLAAL